jgi:SAM-dependent methyltransferase
VEHNPSHPKDVFANGMAYEPYVGRWSRLVAREFLRWLDVPARSRWLDVGCGTGALSQTILETVAPSMVTGVDRSPGFIAFARQQVQDERVRFEVGEAQSLPVATGEYDAVVSGLVLNFTPQPDQTVAEMARATRNSGLAALYVWDYAEKMQFMRYFWDAAIEIDPAAAELDEGRRFPLCQPEPLERLLAGAGLQDVEVVPIEISTHFRNFDDFWTPFLGGQGAAPAYLMTLSDEHRVSLRERLRVELPIALDGSLPLVARAWAVRGVRR